MAVTTEAEMGSDGVGWESISQSMGYMYQSG